MEILYFLIPISLILLGVIVGLFLWSVKSGQFDDMEGPAYRILMDDEVKVSAVDKGASNSKSVDATSETPSKSEKPGTD